MATENKDEAIELNNLVATLEYMFLHKLTLLVFVIMLLAGFLLYATMFVEIGLKSDQNTDIQKNIMLILLPLLVAILLQQWIAYEPKGLLSQLLLYFPLTTPITTVFLYSLSELSTEQIILACMILIFSITLQLYKLDNKLKKSLFN
jgi:ABC-2 type transport system permease protein